jgi:hypothetical protein
MKTIGHIEHARTEGALYKTTQAYPDKMLDPNIAPDYKQPISALF